VTCSNDRARLAVHEHDREALIRVQRGREDLNSPVAQSDCSLVLACAPLTPERFRVADTRLSGTRLTTEPLQHRPRVARRYHARAQIARCGRCQPGTSPRQNVTRPSRQICVANFAVPGRQSCRRT
jgi:hypothetical protein